jgi:hypothetical protein
MKHCFGLSRCFYSHAFMTSLHRLISRHDKKGAIMASGDHLKTWFPAMVDELRRLWQPGMLWPEIIALLRHLEQNCSSIKLQANLDANKIPCASCGGGVAEATKISVRSFLYALRNSMIVPEMQFRNLERDWLVYKRKHKLDGYAERKTTGQG